MRTTTWRALLALALVVTTAGGLAACGGGSSDDASTTSEATADAGTDAGTDDATATTEASDPTDTVATSAAPASDQPGCEEIEAMVVEIEGSEPTSSNDIGGLCEYRFGANSDWPGYSVLWNYGAVDRVQFEAMRDMLAGPSMEQVDGPGTEFWVEVDASAATTHAYVWIEGAGAWDLNYVQPFDGEPQPGDADKLKQLGEALTNS